MSNVLVALAAFVVTLLAIVALRPVAVSIHLVDLPGGRKTHHGAVPLCGGLGIFLGVAVGLGLLHPAWPETGPLLAVFGIMVVTGLFDDRFGLSPKVRLAVQALAGILLITTTDVLVRYIGNPFGLGYHTLVPWAALLFTLLMVMGAVNAFNMLDGMDGLAGLHALVSLTGLGWLASRSGQGETELAVCWVLGAAVLAFLCFNVPVFFNHGLRVFLGDAGSTLIGVAVAWLCASISQMPLGHYPHPTYVLWMVAMPLYELWFTFIRRLASGHSPFHADAGHFHHRMVAAGMSVRWAFVSFLVLDLVLMAVGMTLAELEVPGWVAFGSLIACGLLVVRSMYSVHHLVRWLPFTARQAGAAPQGPQAGVSG